MRRRLFFALVASLVAMVALAGGTLAGGRPLATALTGGAEVPGPGDPDGSGMATLRLNQGQGTICYELRVSGIAPATAAHIHEAPAGQAGPVVVPLAAPSGGMSAACVSVGKALVKEIRQHPENYYVNVHNADFPAGALRVDLSR